MMGQVPAAPFLAGRRIGLLTAWAAPAGGGVAEAVARQAAMIRAAGGEARVFALAVPGSEATASLHRTHGPAVIGYAPSLLAALRAARLDCLHLHGIWMYPSRAGALWARATGRPYVVSPHGMLDPWITARGRWKKALARCGYEKASWRRARLFHALSADEAADIARATGHGAITVIPNAAPPLAMAGAARGAGHVVYLGRIHPKKNLAALVAGWRQARLPAGSRLTIAGWGAAADVARLAAAIGDAPDIAFAGPLFDAAKHDLLRSARFTILPSLSEGLPMAVLEGWAAGTPALLSEACHLPEGIAAGAAIGCGTTPDTIARALERALALDAPDWEAMAAAARGLAAGHFGAATIAARWVGAYGALIAGDEPA
ncbi:MAG: glycosyltransferase [Sphingomonadales bacterium]|nr:glycosyltransferase [Sphingomonadales bacterium]